MLATSASLSFYGGNLILINLFDTKYNFSLFHFPNDTAPEFLEKLNW